MSEDALLDYYNNNQQDYVVEEERKRQPYSVSVAPIGG